MALPASPPSPRPARSSWSLPQLHQWLAVPLIVALVTATVGRLLVYSPGIGAQEVELLQRLHEAGSAALDVPALVLHHAFSAPGALGIVAALTAWLVLSRRRVLDAAGFAVTALSGCAAVVMLGLAVSRSHPDTSSFAEPLVLVDGLTSFPSARTGAAVAITASFLLAVRRSRRAPAVLALGLGISVLVGAAQLHLGVHYPLDVLASFPVAWAGVAAGCGVANAVVPALAFGFGWHQDGVEWSSTEDARPAADGSAADEPAEQERPESARVPVVVGRSGHHAA